MSTTNTLTTPIPHAPTRPTARPVRGARPAPTTDANQTTTGHLTDPTAANWNHVHAAQKGDSDAFGRLYSQYAHIVYRYVLFRVSDHCLAEDITSETFLRALRRITSISYQGRDVAAWFITIAKNLILDHLKSSRTRLEVPTSDLIDSTHTIRPQQIGPEQQVLTDATHAELLHCVRQLNPDQRECIRLRFLQGMSVTETATHMQRNEGAIKALQHRAIRRLAQLLPDGLR